MVAICGGCEISDLEWLIERVTIGEDDLLKGMKMLVSACLEESIYGKIHLEEEREALEKNMIGCGLRLELEA